MHQRRAVLWSETLLGWNEPQGIILSCRMQMTIEANSRRAMGPAGSVDTSLKDLNVEAQLEGVPSV